MGQLKISKYAYNKEGSFEVRDSYGQVYWIVLEQEINLTADDVSGHVGKEWKPVPIEMGY